MKADILASSGLCIVNDLGLAFLTAETLPQKLLIFLGEVTQSDVLQPSSHWAAGQTLLLCCLLGSINMNRIILSNGTLNKLASSKHQE